MKYVKQTREFLSAIVFTLCAVFGATSSFAVEPSAVFSSEVGTIQTATQNININTASAMDLAQALTGVGLKKAEEIVAFRNLNGQFAAAIEITEVKGIGPATFEKNKDRIVVR